MQRNDMADVTWIVMTEPIKALIDTNTLEVHVAVDESIREFFVEFGVTRRNGIEYYSLKEAKQAAKQHCDECDEEYCQEKYDKLLITLEAIEDKVLKAVSM